MSNPETTIPMDWMSAYIAWHVLAIRHERNTVNDAFRAGWYAALQAVAKVENQNEQ